MAMLNIGLSGLTLKSNVQVGDESWMDEVIGKASLMKSVRADAQEYEKELPLYISVLDRRLGRNVDVSASNGTDEPDIISEDRNYEEEIQEASDSVEIQEVVEVFHQSDSYRSTSPTISKQVRKLFPGMGWFSDKIDDIRQEDNGNTYEILFKDGGTEEWRQGKYY